jgi:NCAIR mutase (PurE)-related protein
MEHSGTNPSIDGNATSREAPRDQATEHRMPPDQTTRHQVTQPGFTDLGFARLDTDRRSRTGDPEVILASGKTPGQVVTALRALSAAHPDRAILATRLDPESIRACADELPGCRIDETGRTAVLGDEPAGRGRVVVVTAGTGDLPVALECATTVRVHGAAAEVIPDVGVAGLHRLLAVADDLRAVDALVVVAGMDAALPSVVGGLVGVPVIAVPTSVGYGWNMDGLTAFLAMLNSCAAGVLAVNVDNGFGAGVAAARIARATAGAR